MDEAHQIHHGIRYWRHGAAIYFTTHFGKSLLWVAADVLTLYALTSVQHLRPDVAGWIFLVSLCWHALCDVLVGLWVDWRHSKGRDMAVIVSASSLIAPLAFVAALLAAPMGAAAVLVATLVFRLAYACYDVPHNALIAQLANRGLDPAMLARGRTVGTNLAALAISFAALPLVNVVDKDWVLAIIALSIAGSAAMLSLPLGGLLRRQGQMSPPSVLSADQRRPIPWDLICFLTAAAIGIAMFGAVSKGLLQLAPSAPGGAWQRWWVVEPVPDPGMAFLVFTVGRLAAALPFPSSWLGGNYFSALIAAYIASAAIVGMMTTSLSVAMIFCFGLVTGLVNLLNWATLAAVGRSAAFFGLFTMLSKVALGLSGFVCTLFLGEASTMAPSHFRNLIAAATCAAAIAAALSACAYYHKRAQHLP